MKPHSTPVNKSDGFMPVRGASMATDHDTFSDSSNLIHSSTVSSSSRPILSSLPQEPAKPSRYYVNQCAVVVELLLRLFNCGCSVSIHPLRVLNATDIFLRIVWSAGWVASHLVQSRPLPPHLFVSLPKEPWDHRNSLSSPHGTIMFERPMKSRITTCFHTKIFSIESCVVWC